MDSNIGLSFDYGLGKMLSTISADPSGCASIGLTEYNRSVGRAPEIMLSPREEDSEDWDDEEDGDWEDEDYDGEDEFDDPDEFEYEDDEDEDDYWDDDEDIDLDDKDDDF